MRARDLGIPFEGICGTYNAITDVDGVEIGYSSIIEGEPDEKNTTASEFARTGVTCILPQGRNRSSLFAGMAIWNGNGEMTGTHWIKDSGFLHGPIMLTNTHSVGVVRDSVSKWMVDNELFPPYYKEGKLVPGLGFFYPVVGETWDGVLNNIGGFRVRPEHVMEAINSASGGPVKEGNVGGGTGMRCHGFKGGTGTASRIIKKAFGEYTIGALVQANHGTREELTIKGIPVGKMIKGYEQDIPHYSPKDGDGSIVAVIATDAPLMPWQLEKIARRAALGIGRVGGGNQNGSGDLFIAFSTANKNAFSYSISEIKMISDEIIDEFYVGATEAVEEAILNVLCEAETMIGRNNNTVYSLPLNQVKEILENFKNIVNAYK